MLLGATVVAGHLADHDAPDHDAKRDHDRKGDDHKKRDDHKDDDKKRDDDRKELPVTGPGGAATAGAGLLLLGLGILARFLGRRTAMV